MKSVKVKLIISNVLLGVLTLLLVGVTIAYFTDTKQISNTLTAGNVKIMLSESAVKRDSAGNLVKDEGATKIFGKPNETVNNYGVIYPGQTICKDPLVENIGNTDAWVAVKVTLTDGRGTLNSLIGYEGYEDIDIELLLGGGLLDEKVHVGTWNNIPYVCHNDKYAMVQVSNVNDGKWEFYFFYLSKFTHGDSSTVFESLNIPVQWNNQEMEKIADLKIKVQAFASQTQGFDTCFDAMKTAFPEHFKFN